jgi:DNA polymerase-3 subunit delta'
MTPDEVWAGVVGQDQAVARLRAAATAPVHAYLLLGPPGSGARGAARGFAALVLADGLTGPAAERARRLAVEGKHPDLVVVEAQGRTLRVGGPGSPGELKAIRDAAVRSPVEGPRKVVVVPAIDHAEAEVLGALLKLVEEPPESTVLVFLAAEVPPELVTVASRCVTIELRPVPAGVIEATLAAEGVEAARAAAAADAAGGDLDRARLLATDDGLAARRRLWWELPERLDGSGAAVVAAVKALRAAIDDAQGPLISRQVEEVKALEERVQQLGERGSGRAELAARHKRELRRLRDDELRFGLATLARRYHQELVASPDTGVEAALAAIQEASEALVRNPNEALLLEALALRLPSRARAG